MIDLREHKAAILEGLKEVRAQDDNWGWSIKSLSKKKVLIRWGYLDYCDGGSRISVRVVDDGDGAGGLAARMDDRYEVDYLLDDGADDLIVLIGKKIWCDTNDWDEGIRKIIRNIGYIARTRY